MYTKYLVSFTIWSYTFLFIFNINVNCYQVKMSMFYNVQTIKSAFVGQKMRCIVNNCSVVQFHIVSHTKYHI